LQASKRKSAAAVALSGGERTLGDEAAALATRYPERVYLRARDLLGRPWNSSGVRALLTASALPYTPLAAAGERGTIALATQESAPERAVLSAEELAASVLHYVARCGQEQLGAGAAPLRDAVITVPPFWSQAQRSALSDAAALAGLNLLSLVSEPAAAALQYGIDKEAPANGTTDLVVFVDVGAGSSTASLVGYSGWKVRDGSAKGKTVPQFEIKATAWDDTAGAEALDMVLAGACAPPARARPARARSARRTCFRPLPSRASRLCHPLASPHLPLSAEHFALEANAKIGGGVDVRKSARSMAKLRKQCKRTKEILSANAEAPISVESLYEEFDFRSSITRAQFEALGAPLFERMAAPLARLLEQAGLAPADPLAIELIGGGTRIPAVQAALSAALKGRSLDRHMDADEAVAMGAGLLAANLSTTFRMRRYGASDAASFGVVLAREGGSAAGAASATPADGEAGEEGEEEASANATAGAGGAANAPKLLIPMGKRLPARRVVSYNSIASDFSVAASYDASARLPPAVVADGVGALLTSWRVGGVASASATHNSTGKVTLTFSMGRDGLLLLEKAELGYEFMETYEELVVANASDAAGNVTNGTNASMPTITIPAAEEEGDASAGAGAEAEAGGARRLLAAPKTGKKKPPPPAKKASPPPPATKKPAPPPTKKASPPPPPPKKKGAAKEKSKAPPPATSPLNRTLAEEEEAAAAAAAAAEAASAAPKGGNATAPAANATGANATGANSSSAPPPAPPPPPPPPMVKVKRTRLRTSRLPLTVTPASFPLAGAPLASPQRGASASLLENLKREDEARAATGRAKSGLEAYIIKQRELYESLDEESPLATALWQVTDGEGRATFLASLAEAEEWLYGKGESGDAAAFAAKHASLSSVGDAAEARASEMRARPAAAARARAFAAETRAAVAEWGETRPQVNETEKEGLLEAVGGLEAWLAEAEAAQAQLKATAEPAFRAADVAAQTKPVEALLAKLKKKPAPKPPPPPPSPPSPPPAVDEEEAGAAAQSTEAAEPPPAAHSELRKSNKL